MPRPDISLSKELPTADFVRDYVDIPLCENGCSHCVRYGKYWTCPPFGFSRLEFWTRYSAVLLYGKKVFVSESLRREPLPDTVLYDEWERLLAPSKKRLMVELYAMEQSTPGSLALSCGGCGLCASCTRPQGEPCRNSDRMRFSVEALGANVEKCVSELLGEKLLWAEGGKLPEYFVLMGALLIP